LLFTGMVLALQTAYSLATYGGQAFVGDIVALSVVRELGPVLTALMVAGRVGAGVTAELGSMAVTEQVDAMRALAANPVKKLVVPKLIATLVMLPLLTIIGDLLGVLGGMIIGVYQLGLTPGFYINDVLTDLTLEDIFSGIGKSFFFAFWITIVGCYNGLTARGGADGVGRATTNTVVVAAILVLVTDFFLTKLFHVLA